MSDKTAFLLSSVPALLCACLAALFLRACARRSYRRAFWLKGLAGLCFVVCGALGLAHCGERRFGLFVFAGLCLGLLGDELLAIRFLDTDRSLSWFSAGAAAFSVGHACYLAALLPRWGFGWGAAACLLAGLALGWLYAKKRQTDAGELRKKAVAYLALVTLVAAAGCGALLRTPEPAAALFALGGVLFAVSDNVLVARSFGRAGERRANAVIHATYYLAQFSIAWTLFFIK